MVDCFDQTWRKGLNAPEWSFQGVAVEKWRSLVFWGRVIVPFLSKQGLNIHSYF